MINSYRGTNGEARGEQIVRFIRRCENVTDLSVFRGPDNPDFGVIIEAAASLPFLEDLTIDTNSDSALDSFVQALPDFKNLEVLHIAGVEDDETFCMQETILYNVRPGLFVFNGQDEE
jgi:hypothetical protein